MNLPLNIDFQQVLLHIFNSFLLFVILYFLLYKPVKSFIDKREDFYKEMDDKANEKLSDADRLLKEYNEKLSSVDKEIELKKAEANKILEAENSARIEKAREQADGIVAKAVAQAKIERDSIFSQANSEITDMVSSAAEKIVFSDTSEAFDKFLDNAEGSGKDE